jgi:isoquinoline 1-oxidoreductase beta subunit
MESSCSEPASPTIRSPTNWPSTSCSPHTRDLSTLRGVGVGPNGFAIESFVDELAKAWGKNPLAFRLELAEGMPRMQALMHAVAQMSDWTRKREGTALGLALQEKAETLAAGVAEVSVDRNSGKIKVHNFWAASDAGLAVQPRNLAAQTEGGIVWGLGHVLRERIVIRNGRVLQTNYTDYEVARLTCPISRSRWCPPTMLPRAPVRTACRWSPPPSVTRSLS